METNQKEALLQKAISQLETDIRAKKDEADKSLTAQIEASNQEKLNMQKQFDQWKLVGGLCLSLLS